MEPPMRSTSATAVAALLGLLLCAPATAVGQINLSWDDCSTFGARTKRFACDRNDETNTLVLSFIAPAGVDSFVAIEGRLYLDQDAAAPPDWWRLRDQTGQINQCRNGALTTNANFLNGPTSCANPFPDGAIGGTASYQVGYMGSGRTRLLLVFADPQYESHSRPLEAGVEYYAAKVVIDDRKTVGTDVCTGCTTPMAIRLDQIRVVQSNGSPAGDFVLTQAAQSQTVGWQCDYVAYEFDCSTAAKLKTWGAIKSLYR